MLKKMLLVLIALVVGAGSVVMANTPVVNRRERNQMKRIHQGVKSGALTKGEARELKQEVKGVNDEKRGMREQNGGKPLTQEQRKDLRHDLNKTSKDIYKAKHPAQPAQPATGAN